MSIRAAVWITVSLFVLSLLGAFALRLWDSRALTLRDIAKRRNVEWLWPRAMLWDTTQSVILVLNPDGRFNVNHPAGLADGRATIKGRRVTLTFERVDLIPIAQWPQRFRQVRDKAIAEAWTKAQTGTGWPHDDLKQYKRLEDVLPGLQKDFPGAADDPFAKPWVFEVDPRGQWIGIDPPQMYTETP